MVRIQGLRQQVTHASAILTLFLAIGGVMPDAIAGQTERGAPEVARRAVSSVVTLRAFDEHGEQKGLGSGFVMLDGRIATNCHVIEGASWVEIVSQSDEYLGTANYAEAISTRLDLAILPSLAKSATGDKGLFVSSSRPEVGEAVWVIGSPQGLSGTLSGGILSSIREIDGRTLLQVTAPISQGSSGGPVLDSNGQVVGVAVGLMPRGQNLNFAIPATDLVSLGRSSPGRFPFPSSSSARTGEVARVPESADPDSEFSDVAVILTLLATASDLQPGETRQGAIRNDDLDLDGRHYDIYKIRGSQGDRVQIDMWSNEIDPLMFMYYTEDEGEEYWSMSDDDGGDGTDSRIVSVLPEDGFYLIFAMSYEDVLGRYSIAVNNPPAARAQTTSESSGRWRYLGDDTDQDGWYWDSESIRRVGSHVTVWVRVVYAETQNEEGETYNRLTSQYGVNCSNRQIQQVSTVLSLNGSTVDSWTRETWERSWSPITPETMGEALFESVCR